MAEKGLGEFIKIYKGSKVEDVYFNKKDNTQRFIQIEDLRTNDNLKFTSDKGFEVNEKDILIAWDGANAGTVSYGLKGIIGSTIAALRIEDKEIFTPYVGKYLQFKSEYLRKSTTGATIPHIRRETLENIKIPFPKSYNEQKKISDLIDKAACLIQNRQETMKLTDEFLRSTFLVMFGDPRLNSKAWVKEKLSNLCDIRRGASPRPIDDYVGGTVPWVKIGDGTNGNDLYIESTTEAITELGALKSVRLKEGAMIFANCGVSLGFARILKIEGCIHDGWLSFENFSTKINKIYLLKLINLLTPYLRQLAPAGTQPNLNTTIMKNFDVMVPPKEFQDKFEEIVLKTETLKQKYKRSLIEIENQFNSMVQRAFSGELLKLK